MEARVAHSRFCGQAGLTGLAATALLSALCAAFVVNDARAETTISRHSNLEFPRPASIEPNIKFWVDTFPSYTARDFVLHDKDDIWKVYKVLRVPGDGDPTPEDVQWANTYLKTKYADILNRLAEGHQPGPENALQDAVEHELRQAFGGAAQCRGDREPDDEGGFTEGLME